METLSSSSGKSNPSASRSFEQDTDCLHVQNNLQLLTPEVKFDALD